MPQHLPTRTRPAASRTVRGFTLVEMLVVVALLGIVASLALPRYRNATIRARESVLKHDLWVMRDVIDQFFTDQKRYPNDLDELVSLGYLRKIPIDPFTQSADDWEVSYEALSDEGYDTPETEQPGVTDVHSGAPGRALDGSYYNEW